MILTKITEYYNLIEAKHMEKWLKFKQNKQNVRVQYNQRTDMFEVLHDVKINRKDKQ